MQVVLNKDEDLVKAVKEVIEKRGGYFNFIKEKTEENKCMCKEFRDQIKDPDFEGYCHCMLYYKSK